jgi:serine protease Do
VVLEYNGQAINDALQLPRLVASSPPGSSAKLAIWRDGARQEVSVTIGEISPEPIAETPRPAQQAPANQLGLVLSEVPPALRKQLGIDYGLLVQAVEGAAADTPIRPGDIIVAINQSRFSSLAEFNRILARQKAGDAVAFLVRRGDQVTYVTIKVPS